MTFNALATASSKFDLKISIKKTEVMFRSKSTTAMGVDINVGDTMLNPAHDFTYLGSIIAKENVIGQHVLGCLHERLCNYQNVPRRVKGKIYRTIILFDKIF